MTNDSSRYDKRIRKSLKDRKGDPVALTQFAVSAINHFDDDTFAQLKPETHQALFRAMAANGYDLSVYKYLTGLLEEFDEISFSDKRSKNHEEAYYKILPFVRHENESYSRKFGKKIMTSMDATLLQAKYEGDWKTTPFNEKINHARKEARKFLDHYDPDRLMHDNDRFEDPYIVGINTRPMTEEDMKEIPPAAHFDQAYDMVFFRRYMTKFHDEAYLQRHNPDNDIDYQGTRDAIDAGLVDMEQENFAFDGVRGPFHRQHDGNLDLQYLSLIDDEHETMAFLAHELFHLISFRVVQLYHIQPDRTKKSFGFNKKDFDTWTSANVAYKNTGEEYMQNKEEVMARKIQGKVYKAWEKKHKPATDTGRGKHDELKL